MQIHDLFIRNICLRTLPRISQMNATPSHDTPIFFLEIFSNFTHLFLKNYQSNLLFHQRKVAQSLEVSFGHKIIRIWNFAMIIIGNRNGFNSKTIYKETSIIIVSLMKNNKNKQYSSSYIIQIYKCFISTLFNNITIQKIIISNKMQT